jgi:hypothetical protein
MRHLDGLSFVRLGGRSIAGQRGEEGVDIGSVISD